MDEAWGRNFFFFQAEDGIRDVAVTGVQTCALPISAVLGKEDLIVSDELNHASIIDGARLSKATIKIFKHKDVEDCERILQEHASLPGKKLIITDGVFRSEEHTSELQSRLHLVCRLLLEKKKTKGHAARRAPPYQARPPPRSAGRSAPPPSGAAPVRPGHRAAQPGARSATPGRSCPGRS